MALQVNQATLLALHLGGMKDQGRLRPEHVSMGKLANVDAALEVGRKSGRVLYGYGARPRLW
jgi:glutaryl-CoA dehydrogenase